MVIDPILLSDGSRIEFLVGADGRVESRIVATTVTGFDLDLPLSPDPNLVNAPGLMDVAAKIPELTRLRLRRSMRVVHRSYQPL